MGYPARIVLAWVVILGGSLGGGSRVWAENAAPSGTLQTPSRPQRDLPAKPPAAAPRQPVHSGEAGAAKPPVVPPHGPVHPHRPTAAAAAGKVAPAPPAAPPVAQEQPPPESKTAAPEKLPDPEKPGGVAARLPRFASLRSDDVNMRAGPGTRYRIDWVYKRRDLPVEIEREFDVWRWVRDADGIQGWVHQATLMSRRSFIVEKADATLRSEANDTASAVAVLKPGVIGRIRSCGAASDWCNVQTGSYRGYLHRAQFWGTLPDEAITP
jgi:SH3-like domain-containing protein